MIERKQFSTHEINHQWVDVAHWSRSNGSKCRQNHLTKCNTKHKKKNEKNPSEIVNSINFFNTVLIIRLIAAKSIGNWLVETWKHITLHASAQVEPILMHTLNENSGEKIALFPIKLKNEGNTESEIN